MLRLRIYSGTDHGHFILNNTSQNLPLRHSGLQFIAAHALPPCSSFLWSICPGGKLLLPSFHPPPCLPSPQPLPPLPNKVRTQESPSQQTQPYLGHGASGLECRARRARREEIERQGGRRQEEGEEGGKEEEGELAAAGAAGYGHGWFWALLRGAEPVSRCVCEWL